jgi:hypothetical protein
MQKSSKSRPIRNATLWIIASIVAIVLISSYIQAEIVTNLYAKDIPNIEELCAKKSSDLKGYKLLKYEKYRKELVMYCLYENPKLNTRITANLTNIWTVVQTDKLNEKGGLYWPIYR